MSNTEILSGIVSQPTLHRLPVYLNYLRLKRDLGAVNISSTAIAEDLRLNPVQVRKDLALVSNSGRPKTGFDINDLIDNIETFLGYKNTKDVVLVGAGKLGRTLLSYNGFSLCGLNILAAFDNDENIIETEINGKKIFHTDKMKDLIKRLGVHIGIITVTAENAQKSCDMLIDAGILAIWNFAPVHLSVPENIIVQNENLAASLAILSNKLQAELSNK